MSVTRDLLLDLNFWIDTHTPIVTVILSSSNFNVLQGSAEHEVQDHIQLRELCFAYHQISFTVTRLWHWEVVLLSKRDWQLNRCASISWMHRFPFVLPAANSGTTVPNVTEKLRRTHWQRLWKCHSSARNVERPSEKTCCSMRRVMNTVHTATIIT